MRVGEKLRKARTDRGWSLQQVAERAGVSPATLSRIENGKQEVSLSMLETLSSILGQRLAALFDEGNGGDTADNLARMLAGLDGSSRRQIWIQLAEEVREKPGIRRGDGRELASEVEELLAQIDFLRAEVEAVRRQIR